MSVTVKLSTPFREVTKGRGEISADGASLEELLGNLESSFPGFKEMIFDDNGNMTDHTHIFINGEDYRPLGGLGAELADGDVVLVLFSISGG